MGNNLHVLIVDDEKIVRESLGSWLKEDGYSVDICESGECALEKMELENYDIAVVDIHMPGIDGIELIRRIKSHWPNMLILIMTAYASVDTAVKAMKIGAYDYIVKPFDPEALNHAIRRAINCNLAEITRQ